jgi:hypothetical protein
MSLRPFARGALELVEDRGRHARPRVVGQAAAGEVLLLSEDPVDLRPSGQLRPRTKVTALEPLLAHDEHRALYERMFGEQFGEQSESNCARLRAKEPSKYGPHQLRRTPSLALGAGRSQVQILSPRSSAGEASGAVTSSGRSRNGRAPRRAGRVTRSVALSILGGRLDSGSRGARERRRLAIGPFGAGSIVLWPRSLVRRGVRLGHAGHIDLPGVIA